ncbi:MAG TPA: hypothetical protein VHL50_08110, partial [Pyrinomonadaceae bacterium]|nr:hypothetical protein [Pyrinomonadaceae bacterium]
VSAHIISVDKVREKEREFDIGYVRSATMVVDTVYKGDVKVGQELTFRQGGGADCVWTYDEDDIGNKYLLYLGKPTVGHPFFPEEEGAAPDAKPMYSVIACGRSRSIVRAGDDLAYLDNMARVRGKTRLSGTFTSWSGEDSSTFANRKVKITGGGRSWFARTDKNGVYEIYDLPPGDYSIEPEIPFGWKINGYMLERSMSGSGGQRLGISVTVKAKRHAALDLYFDADTAIRGRVLSPEGKPMKGVCLMAVSTELKESDRRGPTACTNDKGNYSIEEMAPGNYIIAVNPDGKMDADEPFGVLFYPGVTEQKDAVIVAVEAGKYALKKDIQIPQTTRLTELSGRLLYADGKPVAGEWVKFTPDDKTRFEEENSKTDASGRFYLRVPVGAAGPLSGEKWFYGDSENNNKYKDCPKIQALIKDAGGRLYTGKSDTFNTDGEQPRNDIELTLPVPYCKAADDDR